MGISTYNPRENSPVPSWAIGSREVTALDMAQAFGVLANNGIKMKVHTVRRIEDRNGKTIYECKTEPEQVLSPEAAFITTSILQDVVSSTTARGLSGMGRPLAAKTGTTDDARDIYLATYAPNLVATFWMGYDIKDMGKIVSGWNISTGLMREVFKEVFKTLPKENFPPPPPGVVRVEVCTKSGLLPSDQCRAAGTVRGDYFLRNHVPRLPCDMHVMVDICQASGLLAGEFCPAEQVVQTPFFKRPDYIITDGGWSGGAGRGPLDAAENPPEEICDVHTEHSGAFTHFTASLSKKNDEISLEWGYSGTLLKEFELHRQVTNGNGGAAVLIGTFGKEQTSYRDKNVQAGKTYVYTLYAVSEQGHRSDPVTANVTVPEPLLKPAAPTDLKAELDDVNKNIVKLTWEAADDLGFEIYRSDKPEPIGTTTKKVYEDHITESGTYIYYVIAYDQLGKKSDKSKSASIDVTIVEEPNGGTGASAPGWLRSSLLAWLSRFSLILARH